MFSLLFHLKYARYLEQKDEGYYVKHAYNYEKSRDADKVTFFTTMEKHISGVGELGGSFLPYSDPFKNIYDLSEDKLRRISYQLFHSEWESQLGESPKADTYRKFKSHMKFESYLLHPDRSERVTYAKLRLSDHKLRIEVGRHQRPKPPREDRVCFICKDKTEDEIHFLTECKLYGSHGQYWNKVYEQFPQVATLNREDQFIFLMAQEDEDITKTVLKWCSESLGLRKLLSDNFCYRL